MWTPIFMNLFEGAESMCSQFGIKLAAIEGCEIIVASYTDEDYSGDAYVLFKKDGKFFEVEGGHCSCFGLSESSYWGDSDSQWKPQEVSLERLHDYTKSVGNINNGTCSTIKRYLESLTA